VTPLVNWSGSAPRAHYPRSRDSAGPGLLRWRTTIVTSARFHARDSHPKGGNKLNGIGSWGGLRGIRVLVAAAASAQAAVSPFSRGELLCMAERAYAGERVGVAALAKLSALYADE
jgi:hypothetical protein